MLDNLDLEAVDIEAPSQSTELLKRIEEQTQIKNKKKRKTIICSIAGTVGLVLFIFMCVFLPPRIKQLKTNMDERKYVRTHKEELYQSLNQKLMLYDAYNDSDIPKLISQLEPYYDMDSFKLRYQNIMNYHELTELIKIYNPSLDSQIEQYLSNISDDYMNVLTLKEDFEYIKETTTKLYSMSKDWSIITKESAKEMREMMSSLCKKASRGWSFSYLANNQDLVILCYDAKLWYQSVYGITLGEGDMSHAPAEFKMSAYSLTKESEDYYTYTNKIIKIYSQDAEGKEIVSTIKAVLYNDTKNTISALVDIEGETFYLSITEK